MCNYSIYMVVLYNCVIYCHGVWVIPEVLIVCSVFFLMVNDPLGLKPNDVRKIPLPKFRLYRKKGSSFITDIVPHRRSYYHPVSQSVSPLISQSVSLSVNQSFSSFILWNLTRTVVTSITISLCILTTTAYWKSVWVFFLNKKISYRFIVKQ